MEHININFTSKLPSQQHIKYESNLMNIFYYILCILWGSWRIVCWINNQTGPILVHIYPLIYINLHVKYLIRTLGVKIKNMKGAPKCQQMQASSQEIYVQGKRIENQFFIYIWAKMFSFFTIWGALGGLQWSDWAYLASPWAHRGPHAPPWGGLQWSDWAYLTFQLSSHPYLCTCEIRKQSENFLSSNPQNEKKFRAVRPHHRADKFITRETNNHQFFLFRPQCEKIRILGYSGGGGLGGP